MLFVHYPKCSTCKRAEAWLNDHGLAHDSRDIKLDNPTAEELRSWHDKSGLPLRRFFNTSGLLYKEYDLKNRLPGMTEQEQYAMLSENGMLVKRPILVTEDTVLVGFREKEWEAALLQYGDPVTFSEKR